MAGNWRRDWRGAVLVWAVVAAGGGAFAATGQAPEDAEALKAALAQKDQEIAALKQAQAQPRLSPAEERTRVQRFYADTFSVNKAEAGEACRKVGGKLWVMVTNTGAGQRPVVSVSCEGL